MEVSSPTRIIMHRWRPEPEVDMDVMHHAEDLSDDSDHTALGIFAECQLWQLWAMGLNDGRFI